MPRILLRSVDNTDILDLEEFRGLVPDEDIRAAYSFCRNYAFRAGRYCARLNWFGDRWPFASSTVLFDSRDKALPSRAQPPAAGGAAVVFEQDPRACFAVFEIHAAPMFMRDDARCRDVVAVGKRGGQVRGAVDGGGLTGAVAELADFDADALAVARPAVVGMIALLGREQVLDNFTIHPR